MQLTLGHLQRLENYYNKKNVDLVAFIIEQQALLKNRQSSDVGRNGSPHSREEIISAGFNRNRRCLPPVGTLVELAKGSHRKEIHGNSNLVPWTSLQKVDSGSNKLFEKRSRNNLRKTNLLTKIYEQPPQDAYSKYKSKKNKRRKHQSDVLVEGFTLNQIMNPRVNVGSR